MDTQALQRVIACAFVRITERRTPCLVRVAIYRCCWRQVLRFMHVLLPVLAWILTRGNCVVLQSMQQLWRQRAAGRFSAATPAITVLTVCAACVVDDSTSGYDSSLVLRLDDAAQRRLAVHHTVHWFYGSALLMYNAGWFARSTHLPSCYTVCLLPVICVCTRFSLPSCPAGCRYLARWYHAAGLLRWRTTAAPPPAILDWFFRLLRHTVLDWTTVGRPTNTG